MPTKRHHYLPQSYLENFIPPGQKTFVVYDKRGLPPRDQTPINTGVESHLYTILEPTGEKNDTIETDIHGPLDGSAAPIVKRWISSASIAAGDYPILATFMASLHARSPRQIALTQEITATLMVKVGEDLARDPTAFADRMSQFNEANPGSAIADVETARQLMLRIRKDFHVSVDREYGMCQSISDIMDVAKSLMEMRWVVCRATPGQHFVVGDSPVSVFVPHPDDRVSFGAGFDHPLAEVAFPLSPECCLYMRRNRGRRFPSTLEFNRRMIWQAERFVVSSHSSDAIEQLVKELDFTIDLPLIDRDALLEGIAATWTRPSE